MVDWELIRQQNQTQINKDNIGKNRKRVDHDYKVGYKVILNNHYAYKYETPYKGPFLITQCWTNGTVTLQYGPKKIRHNIGWIEPYTSDKNVEDINPEDMYDDVKILSPGIYFSITLNLGKKLNNYMSTETLTLSYIVSAREVFHDKVIFFTWAAPQVTR